MYRGVEAWMAVANCPVLPFYILPMNKPVLQLPYTRQVSSNIEKEGAINLGRAIGVVSDNRRLIAGIALVCALLGAAYAFLTKPVYEASLLVQVEESAGTQRLFPGDISSAFDLKTAAASEMEVLRSRMVVARAIDLTHSYIDVQPKYFPLAGAWLAGRSKQLSDPGLFGHGGYVWGTERADVSVFNVPAEMEGVPFSLTAGSDGEFVLTREDEAIEIKGRAGKMVTTRAGNGEIQLLVDRIAAKPGAQFSITRLPRIVAIQNLQEALKIAEKGKQSGVIGVTLEGPDPKRTAAILDEIGRGYIRQNEYRKSETAEKSLASLDMQLPQLKQELESSEARYNEVRNKYGTIDLGEEAKGLLQQSISSQTRLSELKQKRADLSVRFEATHPAVEAVDQQMRALDRELAGINGRIRKLPEVEQEVLRLKRDVQVNRDVYTAVLSTAQQLRLATASKVGNVRLLDSPEIPAKPTKPKRALVILLAALIGLLLGVLVAFFRKAVYGHVDDPQEIEQLLGLPVCAAIPHSDSSKRMTKGTQIERREESALLPYDAPFDGVVESLHRFRASLPMAMADCRNNIILITGPTPGVGKSFVSANFAVVLASIGKSVLLIDADLRTGHLHQYFGVGRRRGLSDAIAGNVTLDEAIRKEVRRGVDFVSTGDLPPYPAELLAHENFGMLLQQVSARYDFVLIDTAPVLAVSDALTIGPYAGAVFNIVRGGLSTMAEIEQAVNRLNQAGSNVTGTVFNDLKSRSAKYDYPYRGKQKPESAGAFEC